jgi:hypothetical protein
MAQQEKRSISLPLELARAIEEASAKSGSSFSAGIAETASRRLSLEAGYRGVAAWENIHGALTEIEISVGLHRARELLGQEDPTGSA